MVDYKFKFANLGWECPKCGNVYAPSIPSCWNCDHADQSQLAPPTAQDYAEVSLRYITEVVGIDITTNSHFKTGGYTYEIIGWNNETKKLRCKVVTN